MFRIWDDVRSRHKEDMHAPACPTVMLAMEAELNWRMDIKKPDSPQGLTTIYMCYEKWHESIGGRKRGDGGHANYCSIGIVRIVT